MSTRTTVLIETPYRGRAAHEANPARRVALEDQMRRLHLEYARACMCDSLNRGEAPFLSHLLYTQVWDDDVPVLREDGIAAGLAIGVQLDTTVVYLDHGISDGMRWGIEEAGRAQRDVVWRMLFRPAFTEMHSSPGEIAIDMAHLVNGLGLGELRTVA